MRSRQLRLALATAVATLALVCATVTPGVTGTPAQAASAKAWQVEAKRIKVSKWPARFKSVTGKPGKAPGTAVIRWRASNATTSYYRLDMASTIFHPSSKTMPKKGRNFRSVKIPRSAKSYTISAKLAAKVGAPVGSGNHIYYRFYAVNAAGKKKITRVWPGLEATATSPARLPATGTNIRIATFNVASVRATLNKAGRLPWLDRRDRIASMIRSSGAGIVALQELGPGNTKDGGSLDRGTLTRQTDDLVTAVNMLSPNQPFALVRRTSYYTPGSTNGTQGMRILYDTTRYRQMLHCPDTTGNSQNSPSCSFALPTRPGDAERNRLRAAYAKFTEVATGKQFYVVSAHLDARLGATKAEQRSFGALRKSQARTIIQFMRKLNTEKLPIFVAGDFNSWQNQPVVGASAQQVFLANGFYDGLAAAKRSGVAMATASQWKTTVTPASTGFGSRIDYIMAWGTSGSVEYHNTMLRRDTARVSDHALIWATFRLP